MAMVTGENLNEITCCCEADLFDDFLQCKFSIFEQFCSGLHTQVEQILRRCFTGEGTKLGGEAGESDATSFGHGLQGPGFMQAFRELF